MKLGVGGGLGPLRGGVSNRGVGVGVGPFSAGFGSPKLSGEGCGQVGAMAIGLAVMFCLVAWPFWLGSWIAVQLGARDPSTSRTVIGWIFEIAYFAALAWLARWWWLRRARALRRDSIRQEVWVLSDFLDQLNAVEAAIAGFVPSASQGAIATVPSVELVQPRVPGRNQRSMPTSVDEGSLVISKTGMRFVGRSKTADWNFAKVVRWTYDDDYLAIGVSNRQTISGVRSRNGVDDALLIAADWARSGPSPQSTKESLAELRAISRGVHTSLAQAVSTLGDAPAAPTVPADLRESPSRTSMAPEADGSAVDQLQDADAHSTGAGWYDNPDDPTNQWRWWDGDGWSSHTSPKQTGGASSSSG